MSIPASANPLLLRSAAPTSYQIQRSLRFNSADSAYLSRTPASAGNRKTWTWAGWVKRSALGARYGLFAAGSDGCEFFFEQSVGADKLHFYYYNNSASAYQGQCITTGLFRDPSAWYHVVLAVDTTQGTASNRCKIYVNGVEQATSFTTNFGSSADLDVNNTVSHKVGGTNSGGGAFNFNGYLADIHFIDGQALDATSFGEFDANGIWQPKAYSGTYGTNGFRLDFADNASTTTIGYDAAGSNDWTANNLSVTAGSGNDSLVDSPTSYGTDTGAGGEVRGNYCTWNPLKKSSADTFSNGNLDVVLGGSANATFVFGSVGITSGKFYWEVTVNSVSSSYPGPGVCTDLNRATDLSGFASSDYLYLPNGNKQNTSASAYGATFAGGDIIGVALDMTAGTLIFYKNGVSQGQAFSGITGTAVPIVLGGVSVTIATNFGQRPFAYTAPSGYKALNTANLPTPTIAKGSDYFDTKLYTGNGSTQTISGLGFSPDLVWIKVRSTGYGNRVFDTVRGTGGLLYTNTTDAEVAQPNANDNFSSFNSNGFSLGAGIGLNENNSTYVAWAWDAGSSTVTNTAGTIQSTVRANATAGFSVVTFTTQASGTATVGHGLGVAPEFFIIKARSIANNWWCYHKSLATPQSNAIALNLTNAALGSTTLWNNTAPSSSVISFSSDWAGSNTAVVYCFAPVSGYSAFGSFTGGGSTPVFVYLGFRPKFLLVKNASSGGTYDYWLMKDSARDTHNASINTLVADLADAENTPATIGANQYYDFVSNGFVNRTIGAFNSSGNTFVYAAFAENPFALARAR